MRVSWKGAAATVSSAALLVVGVDYATLATTGDSLLLGRANTADRITTISKQGPGPVLALNSDGNSAPSLRVSSAARVTSLNADMIDGRHATDLVTRATTYRAGRRGDVVTGGFGAWALPLDPGPYQVTFSAFAIPAQEQGEAPVSMICGIIDLNTVGPRTYVFTADSAIYTGDLPVAMSGGETVRVREGQNPGLICTTGNGGDFTFFKAATASVTPIESRQLRPAESVTGPANTRGLGSLAPR